MSIIAEYKALEAQIAEQTARLEALKNDQKLQKEIEFENKLRALLAEYNYSLRNVIALLDPNAGKASVAPVKVLAASAPLRSTKPEHGAW